MPEKNLYEYAVLRIVPRVEREEFINVGIILYCHADKFLQTRYCVPSEKLLALDASVNLQEISERLHAFELICKGAEGSGEIGKLPAASRFRWLTAKRSTVVQSSPVHPGLCDCADNTIDRLFNQLVL